MLQMKHLQIILTSEGQKSRDAILDFGGSIISFRYSKCIFETHVVSFCTRISLSPHLYLFYFSSGNVSDFKELSVRWEKFI